MPKPLRILISKLARLEKLALLVLIVLILLVGVGVWRLARYLDQQNTEYFANIPNQNFKSYSLSGKVISVDSKKLVLEVGQVVADKNGNAIEYKQYTALIQPTTALLKRNSTGSLEPVLIADIKPGNEVTAYTSQNPYNLKQIIASRIELN